MPITWAVGVTTCPRAETYLPVTLASVQAAGWANPLVYNDRELRGAWQAFLGCLASLLELEPKATALAVFQDDILLTRGVRSYTEETCWAIHTSDLVILSLYSSAAKEIEIRELNRLSVDIEGYWVPVAGDFGGAQAVILSRRAAKQLLGNPPEKQERNQADVHLGTFCRREGITPLFHLPSLCQHVGKVSAVWDGKANPEMPWNFFRYARSFEE